eukprot:1338409-Lingulodinium_polyedra.AAC.1
MKIGSLAKAEGGHLEWRAQRLSPGRLDRAWHRALARAHLALPLRAGGGSGAQRSGAWQGRH